MTTTIRANNINIGISEYGDPSGIPVFYFHGFPGSRLDGNIFDFDKIGKECAIRIIGVDRPGIGISDFKLNRTLLDWPKLVLSLADHLGINKFSILGVSGGGPYVLSCAYTIPERLHSVSIVSVMGPYSYKESHIGKAMLIPKQIGILRMLIAWGMKLGAIKNPDKLKENIKKTLPPSDLKYLNQYDRMDSLIEVFKECFKQGLKGYLFEAKLYRRKWGFKVSNIKSNVFLWHGTSDNNVSIDLAKRIASEIPNCKSTFIDNEGHFSLTGNYLQKILNELTLK
jgi:pimeloyl-ACP methyl ester carboxylesterase